MAGKTVTRADLSEAVYQKVGLSRTESADLVDALRERGVPAAISGAGPTVLAFTADGVVPPGVDLHGFIPLPLSIDAAGVVVALA